MFISNFVFKFVNWSSYKASCKYKKFCAGNTLFGYFYAKTWKNYCHAWLHHSICQNVIFLANKLFKFRTKFFLFWVFLGWKPKKLLYCDILQKQPQIFPSTRFSSKIKILKFGTKIAVIGYFGLEFQKTNVVFEISILEFVNLQRFIQNQNILNL